LPRVIKHPSIRKAELVSAAQALFFDRGYDRTSVDEIIARAGVSKGAFYYYFPSKEAVLEALVARTAEDALRQMSTVLDDSSLNGLARLNAFLESTRRLKVDRAQEFLAGFEAVFRPENLVLFHRMHQAVSRVVAPVYATIIAQGVAEGIFSVRDPALTAEIVVSLMATTHDVVARLFVAETEEAFARAAAAFERRCTEQGIAIDRILGVPDGSIQFIEPGFADAMFAAWRSRQAASA
jgi:AcrR family transcriptional regulator